MKSKREKDDIDIFVMTEYSEYISSYGFMQDFTLINNKWEKLSRTFSTWNSNLHHILEMNDHTILISAYDYLYVLLYPQKK